MNAPKRVNRGMGGGKGNFKDGGGKPKSCKIGATEPMFDQFGEPLRKKAMKNSNPRKTWGA